MKLSNISFFDRVSYRHYRSLHGLRIGLAFLSTLVFINLIELPERTWVLITLIVLIDPMIFLGNVMLQSTQRIFGTLIGVSLGIIGLYLELHHFYLMAIWCGFTIFMSGYCVFGKYPYAALVIGITVAVLLGEPGNNYHTAMWRIVNILFGTFLALCFSYILPLRAFSHWRLHLNVFFDQLSQLRLTQYNAANTHTDKITSSLSKLTQLTTAACKEQHLLPSTLKEINSLCHSIFNDLTSLQRVAKELTACCLSEQQNQAFQVINQQIQTTFTEFAHLTTAPLQQQLSRVPALQIETEIFFTALQQYQQNESIKHLLYGYLWLAQTLQNSTTQLNIKLFQLLQEEK